MDPLAGAETVISAANAFSDRLVKIIIRKTMVTNVRGQDNFMATPEIGWGTLRSDGPTDARCCGLGAQKPELCPEISIALSFCTPLLTPPGEALALKRLLPSAQICGKNGFQFDVSS